METFTKSATKRVGAIVRGISFHERVPGSWVEPNGSSLYSQRFSQVLRFSPPPINQNLEQFSDDCRKYTIAIATLCEWKSCATFLVNYWIRSETETNRTLYARFFPRTRCDRFYAPERHTYFLSLSNIVIFGWKVSFLWTGQNKTKFVFLIFKVRLFVVSQSHNLRSSSRFAMSSSDYFYPRIKYVSSENKTNWSFSEHSWISLT